MPVLTAISSLIVSITTFLVAIIGRKALVAGASMFAAVALTVAMVACIGLIVRQVQALFTIPAFLSSIGWFVPWNLTLCFSSILSAKTCRAAYDLAMEKVRLVNSAS